MSKSNVNYLKKFISEINGLSNSTKIILLVIMVLLLFRPFELILKNDNKGREHNIEMSLVDSKSNNKSHNKKINGKILFDEQGHRFTLISSGLNSIDGTIAIVAYEKDNVNSEDLDFGCNSEYVNGLKKNNLVGCERKYNFEEYDAKAIYRIYLDNVKPSDINRIVINTFVRAKNIKYDAEKIIIGNDFRISPVLNYDEYDLYKINDEYYYNQTIIDKDINININNIRLYDYNIINETVKDINKTKNNLITNTYSTLNINDYRIEYYNDVYKTEYIDLYRVPYLKWEKLIDNLDFTVLLDSEIDENYKHKEYIQKRIELIKFLIEVDKNINN